MSFLLIHIGYSAAVWLNDRKSLITQMDHQTFSTEQVTNLLESGSVHQDLPMSVKGDRILGHSTTPPKPSQTLVPKGREMPGCQNPVSHHRRTRVILMMFLSCLAEALQGPCSGLSSKESVWQAVPKGHPCLLFWQLLAITDVPDVGWRHHCTLLGCPSGAAVGWKVTAG